MSRTFQFEQGEYYHVFNRGVEKRTVFLDQPDRIRFQKLLYLCNSNKSLHFSVIKDDIKGPAIYHVERGKQLVSLGAYCLMGNHFHLLLRERTKGGISQFMQKLVTAYTMYFNIRNERTGSLFEGRFRARHASHDEYLKYLFSYIHLNPMKHVEPKWEEQGIQNGKTSWQYLENYHFSSAVDYLGEKRPERAILSMAKFPGYFRKKDAMLHELLDWLAMKPEEVDNTRFQG